MIPAPQTADELARYRIRHSLNESLMVEAAAGTGKTTEMVWRIVNVLRAGLTTVDRIVAVTFTNKAAGELKLRLRQELDRARARSENADEAAHLEHALAHLEEAAIGTIHSFCAQILRERPVEAQVDPDFEELDEGGARRVYERVFRRWMQEKLNEDSPGLRRVLARLATEHDPDYTPMDSIQNAGWKILEWRDFTRPWWRPPIDRETIIDEIAIGVTAIASDLSRFRADLAEPIRDAIPWIERQPRDYDMLEGFLFRIYKKWKPDYVRPKIDKALFTALDQFRQVADRDLAALLRDELWGLVDLYTNAKRRAGSLDFVDLLLLMRDLVKGNEAVRAYLQDKYTHLYVDEFQDTDPLQVELLLLLAAEDPKQTKWMLATPKAGKLFLVGDPKQSIYKFRRADVQMYQAVSAVLTGKGVGLVQLSRSYRSVPVIQDFVNAAFRNEMKGDHDRAQANYVPLMPFREGIEGQPAVIALPAPDPFSGRYVSNKSINSCQPVSITGFVEWLIQKSNWRIFEPDEKELRPVRPGHICILFRKLVAGGIDLTRDYVRSLETRGIPHLLVGSKTFHWREEVETMRAALSAVEWPEDELAVFATLRGSLFAIPDHVLLRFRHEHGKLDPFRKWPENTHADYEPVRETLTLLAALHRGRNQRPVAESVYRLLEAGRAWAGFAFRPAGNQVLANVRRIIDLARQFETAGGYSFRGFVEELTAQAERAESAEAPVLEEGADGVRIMTVHAAKGLEFPIVILADMTTRISRQDPDKYVETSSGLCAMQLLRCSPHELMQNADIERAREEAEGVRVVYVAATRARDLLVVPTVGVEELKERWITPLNKALYPDRKRARQAERAIGCPAFGSASVLTGPLGYPDESSVKPGLHYGREGATPVVWWDPAALPASQEEYFSDRQSEILGEDAAAEADGEAQHARWAEQRAARLAAGARPAIELVVASEAVAGPSALAVELQVEQTARHAARPTGKRFGALVHAALRDVPLNASREQIAATVELHARLLAAEDEESEEAAFAVYHALHHPLLERARAAARVYREYPVMVREGAVAVEGVIDLAFAERERWVVVDFKTDAEVDGMAARYQAQLAWYAAALRKSKQLPVQCYLLAV